MIVAAGARRPDDASRVVRISERPGPSRIRHADDLPMLVADLHRRRLQHQALHGCIRNRSAANAVVAARLPVTSNRSEDVMKIAIASLVAVLALGVASSADAKGCIKGAIVGGAAGHFAGHHGMLGAAAGCLYGRHRANQQEKQQEQQNQTTGQGKS